MIAWLVPAAAFVLGGAGGAVVAASENRGRSAVRATREQSQRAERRQLLSYNDKVRDEQRFGKTVRQELQAMFFSGGNVGVGMPRTISSEQAGDMAAAFYRKHIAELDDLYRQGATATEAARMVGTRHGVRHFRGSP